MYKQENTNIQMWRSIQRKIVKWPSLALFAQKQIEMLEAAEKNRLQKKQYDDTDFVNCIEIALEDLGEFVNIQTLTEEIQNYLPEITESQVRARFNKELNKEDTPFYKIRKSVEKGESAVTLYGLTYFFNED